MILICENLCMCRLFRDIYTELLKEICDDDEEEEIDSLETTIAVDDIILMIEQSWRTKRWMI